MKIGHKFEKESNRWYVGGLGERKGKGGNDIIIISIIK